MDNQFKGVWPALFTPIRENGDANLPELEKLIDLLVQEKTDGIYLLGSTGQGFLFNEQERMEIAATAIKAVSGRVPVIVQVGAMNTQESVRLAKHASKSGADAISSVGPIYYGGPATMAIEHYRSIATASDLPFFPYQIGKAATNDLIDNLLDMPNVAGMKLTTQNLLEISSIHQRAGSAWSLFSGADELLCQAAMCGTAGAIGTTYNLLSITCRNIRNQFLSGETQTGINFMLALQALIEKVMPAIWTFFQRAMFLKHGIDIGKPKQPLLAPDMPWLDSEILEMVNELESIAAKKHSLDGQA